MSDPSRRPPLPAPGTPCADPGSLAILIVGYKSYGELERCLASIARHAPEVDVVVIDHDADAPRLRAVTANYPRVRAFPRADNPGFAAGVNAAAGHATASVMVLVNPDVELLGPAVARLAGALAAHPDAAVVGGQVRNADGTIQPSARRFPDWTTALGGRTSLLTRVAPGNPLTRRNLDPSAPESGTQTVDWVTGAFAAVRRDVFEGLGGFDERFFLYWEDADFCRRARDAGWRTLYEPAAEAMHTSARSSAHAPLRSLVAFHRSVFRYYWKHGGVLQRAASPLVLLGLAVRLIMRLPAAIARRAA
jgi:N-acetylglucosaminyl-diphospho-decaprenol L-rhamnosyltransferase